MDINVLSLFNVWEAASRVSTLPSFDINCIVYTNLNAHPSELENGLAATQIQSTNRTLETSRGKYLCGRVVLFDEIILANTSVYWKFKRQI